MIQTIMASDVTTLIANKVNARRELTSSSKNWFQWRLNWAWGGSGKASTTTVHPTLQVTLGCPRDLSQPRCLARGIPCAWLSGTYQSCLADQRSIAHWQNLPTYAPTQTSCFCP